MTYIEYIALLLRTAEIQEHWIWLGGLLGVILTVLLIYNIFRVIGKEQSKTDENQNVEIAKLLEWRGAVDQSLKDVKSEMKKMNEQLNHVDKEITKIAVWMEKSTIK